MLVIGKMVWLMVKDSICIMMVQFSKVNGSTIGNMVMAKRCGSITLGMKVNISEVRSMV